VLLQKRVKFYLGRLFISSNTASSGAILQVKL
jgi:hypothetical protein